MSLCPLAALRVVVRWLYEAFRSRALMTVGCPAVLGLLLLMPIPLFAQQEDAQDLTELSLEELLDFDVVHGASRYEQKVNDAPASVSIVSAEDIQSFGYRCGGVWR